VYFLFPVDGVNIEGKLDPTITVKNDGATAEIARKENGEIVEVSHPFPRCCRISL
jgi:hypothetical protein